jgi:hypothetical protein
MRKCGDKACCHVLRSGRCTRPEGNCDDPKRYRKTRKVDKIAEALGASYSIKLPKHLQKMSGPLDWLALLKWREDLHRKEKNPKENK